MIRRLVSLPLGELVRYTSTICANVMYGSGELDLCRSVSCSRAKWAAAAFVGKTPLICLPLTRTCARQPEASL